jgi:flagellar biosynthesis protein
MSGGFSPSPRRVTLRLAGPETKTPPLPPEALELLLTRARALGLPLHHDPQVAAILAALRLREDVPVLLYAAAAAVLASIYDAAGDNP